MSKYAGAERDGRRKGGRGGYMYHKYACMYTVSVRVRSCVKNVCVRLLREKRINVVHPVRTRESGSN